VRDELIRGEDGQTRRSLGALFAFMGEKILNIGNKYDYES